jgi:hypothetical protein
MAFISKKAPRSGKKTATRILSLFKKQPPAGKWRSFQKKPRAAEKTHNTYPLIFKPAAGRHIPNISYLFKNL